MQALDQAKARALITQLEQQQQAQIQCLQALFGLSSEDNARRLEVTDEAKGSTPAPSGSQETITDAPLSQNAIHMPDEWALPWSNALLRERIEERKRDLDCGGGLARRLPNVSAADSAASFIARNALNDLAYFTFEREPQFLKSLDRAKSIAFSVKDFDRRRQISLDTSSCSGLDANSSERKEVLRMLFSQRSADKSACRIIEVNAFTPSALSTILLCGAKDESYDYATIYAALRRHLSTSQTERHYHKVHTYRLESTDNKINYRNITTFTVPYFSLTEKPPASDQAPLSPSGIFGVDAQGEKYIREQKFSVSWSGGVEFGAPSLMMALNPLSGCHGDLADKCEQPSASLWIRNNLLHIVWKWEEVLDWLDEQTTLPSSITFDSEMRQGILFEDRNFSNSKRYFWALQSLRLFVEHIEGTLRSIPNICVSIGLADSSLEDYKTVKSTLAKIQELLEKLRDRMERKRQEIQSLRDGLFSASSVAEGRLALEQNGNIRLLTMVTIVYLPLTLAASIYSMSVLPKSAGIVSYLVVTILMCAVTYVLVWNLQHLKEATSFARSNIYNMLRTMKNRYAEQEVRSARTDSSIAKRASAMA